MNNYIECPVCKASGLKEGSPRCPRCNSDLEVFRQIESLEQGGGGGTAALMIAYFLVLACVVSFLLFYFFVYRDTRSASNVNNFQLKQLTAQIEGLKTENEQYLQQIIDLRTQLGSANETVTKENPTEAAAPMKQVPMEKKNESVKSQSGVIIYEVRSGESLRHIAKKYFGDMEMYTKIMKDNNIKTADQIYPGQKLKIIR